MLIELVKRDTKEMAKLAAMDAIAKPEILEKLKTLSLRASVITKVFDPESENEAVEVSGLMKSIHKEIEASRKEIKQPALDICKAIDEAADSVKVPAMNEISRLQKLLSSYIEEKERIRREEQRKAEAEARRLQEEAEAKARQIREAAEAERKKAEEAASKADQGKGDMFDVIEIEAKVEEMEAKAQALEEQADAPVYVPLAKADNKVKGAAVKREYDYEITNIKELYEHSPLCVDLVAKPSFIKQLIKMAEQQSGGEKIVIPGLKIFPKITVSTRSK